MTPQKGLAFKASIDNRRVPEDGQNENEEEASRCPIKTVMASSFENKNRRIHPEHKQVYQQNHK